MSSPVTRFLRLFRRPLLAAGLLAALAGTDLAAQTTHTVDSIGLDFVPKDLTIQVGDTVEWINLQGMFHNVVEVDCPAGPNSVFNGGISSGGPGQVDVFSHTFTSVEEICYVCEIHLPANMVGSVSVQAADPWVDLGGAAPGIGGTPELDVTGPLTAGSTLTIDLTNAAPSEAILFWMSFASTPLDIFGGTIYTTVPPNLQVLRFANAGGAFSQSVPWPAGIVGGVPIYMQFLIQDLSVPAGITLSNAMMATTP
jgi:plastocyanin